MAVLFLASPIWGVGLGLAQVAAVAAAPEARERTLARWTLWAAVGDLLAPLLLAASVWAGLSWRGALFAVGLTALVQAWTARRAPSPPVEEEEPRVPLRVALRSRGLLGWTLATTVCGLLDEILVAFGALHLALQLGATAAQRAMVLVAWTVGGIAGALVLERLVERVSLARLMFGSALGCAVAYALWLGAQDWRTSAACLFAVGFFASAHYPLLHARAYAAVPERPELAAAAASAISPIDASLPLLIALAAELAGVEGALWLLFAQPVVVLGAARAVLIRR